MIDPDYSCPYCGKAHEADYGDWEYVDFEGETEIECDCGARFVVHRTFVAYYDEFVLDVCKGCESVRDGEKGDSQYCLKHGCEKVRS